ncbi:unnamed protein product [Effrenium voratum]|uniref:Uncharacterized protein n=1 Tax=Effrenium voratum TaxID=2562239 RepID=A0AA36MYX1_9DINO|nr:unnamed protein product [Effrenium voratum]
MAWDMGFNILWTQRIEKEERSFLNGATKQAEVERLAAKEERRRRRSRHRTSSSRSEASSPLSLAGSRSICSSGSRRSERSAGELQKSASESALVPDHFKAAVHFPLTEKDLLTARVKPTTDGTVPKISFKPEKVKALWWPGKQSYVKYHPEFSFKEAPEWSPEDILKGYGIRQQHR